ncbi:GEVED domain-containing protein [Kaistella jeonii]|nr:GEVED domain-containing protein [Kaistella jeonii]SFB93460.1 Por secretion system C-terminal sorting domain-containing protein [Kaistella jeonii]VEI97044.1 Por secretion system C-terminal sorting domain [Kaistella jeonii]
MKIPLRSRMLFGAQCPAQNSFSKPFQKYVLAAFLILSSVGIFGQTNSYLGLNGGFEGAATIVNGTTNSTPVATNWTKSTTTATIANETGTVRSGNNSMKVTSTSGTLCRVFSPTMTISASTTAWQVQYYRRAISTTNTIQNQSGNYRGGTENSSGSYTAVTAANNWQKVTFSPTSTTSATSTAAHMLVKQLGTGGDTFYDDFVLYESATVDVTAPNSPGTVTVNNATTSSLDVSWGAASGGVDGGGYIVVRYASSPNADNDPNQNGIYAVGNNTTNGTGSLVGTVSYIGAGTSFTDSVGLSSGTQYWYKVYTIDKAFNYSSETQQSGTTTPSGSPTLSAGTLTAFGSQCISNTYGPNSFTITGTTITAADVTVAALAGYTFSTTSGGSYSSTLRLTQPGGAYSQDIFVKFSPVTATAYNGNIVVGGGGASDINVAASGTGINTANTITTPTSVAVTINTATLGGNIANIGCSNASTRGVEWSTTNNFTNGTGTQVSASGSFGTGVFTQAVGGLPSGTTIYFKAYSTNSGGTSYSAQSSFATLKTEPTNQPTVFSFGSTTTTTIPLTWTDATGASIPDGYLIKWGSSYGAITPPVDGTAESNGATTQNVVGVSYTATGLTSGTAYYFKIWSYTNSGTSIDYKLGSEPQTTCTTLSAPWEDFEIGTKGPYATGNVTCTAGSWNMSDALIGNIPNDKKNGNSSVRMQNAGVISMNFDLTNGLGTVNILHAVFGSDFSSTWRLEASTDGGVTWTDYVSSTITTSSTTLTNQSFTVNLSGNVRFRIVKISGINKINIDDIYVTPFAACTPAANPVGTITGTTPACTSTVLSYTGADSGNAYWQTTPTGKSTAEPANSTKTVSTSGTYYVRIYNGNCWSTGTVNNAVVVNAPITITTQPANASVVAGSNTSFKAVATNVASYQWQVDAGSGFTNLSNGAPYSTVTTSTLNITNSNFVMNGYKYRCVLTANIPCTDTNTDGTATLTVTNAAPNNALNLVSCLANNQVTLKWDAASGSTTGYIVFVQPNSTIPQMVAASAGNASGYIANTNYSLANSYTTLGKAVFKGNALTATITGLSNLSKYTFKVVAYVGETGTGWAAGINASGSWNQTYTIDVPEITNLTAAINPTTSTVSWNVVPNSPLCYEYMVVANNGAVTLTPTGDGFTYTANANYAGTNSVVFRNTGNSIKVTGLTEGVNYCYKVFVRELNSGNQWSDGLSVCQTTGVSYCASSGSTTDATGITKVEFNTINQTSTGANAYTDFTSVSTSVALGETIPLTVRVNTAGNFTVYTIAWIDWNHDGDFNDSGEEFDLGTAFNKTDGTTSLSPLDITVPTGAYLGDVRMRISAKFNSAATSCITDFDGEVEDYTITIAQPVNAEINVRGLGNSIPNGADTPYGFNNTQFALTNLGSATAPKSFTIENIGLANLNLTGSPIIKIEGANPSDFIVTQQAATPVVNGSPVIFNIKFQPTVAGLRTANVRIENNDSDENPYIFAIEGTGNCTTVPTVNVFPTSGPVNTLVTFSSSTSNLLGATVTYNNVVIPIAFNTTDTIEVLVPNNANDGNFIIQLATGCSKTQSFDVFDTDFSACESSGGGSPASDLMIYEVYDENGGSGGVITLYNRTGASVNLSSYSIQRAKDYGGSYSTYANLTGTIAAGSVTVIGVTGSPGSLCTYPTFNDNFRGGFNANDGFKLMKGATLIDDVKAPNYVGYYLKRKNTNLYPNTPFNPSFWTTQNISPGQCLAGVGIAPDIRTPPTLITSPQYVINCGITGAILTSGGTEGVPGGPSIVYQWYVLGTSGNWNAITNGGVYSGANSQTLSISDLTGLDDYQFYCQIRENNATCYSATNSTQIRIAEKTWDGSNWLGRNNINTSAPTITDKIKLNANYNTGTNGNLNACSLKNMSPYQLTIAPNSYANIEANITNDGSMLIESDGNLLQKNDLATFTGSSITAKRDIVVSTLRQQFNYLISPVIGQSLKTVYSPEPVVQYHSESNNRFYNSTGAYIEGRGLAVKEPASGGATTATFVGAPKNGIINFNIVKGGGDLLDPKRGYNLVGNPYPSNIDLVQLYSQNGGTNGNLDSTVYFWDNKANSQTEQAGSNYGGQAYATFNMFSLGQTNASGDPLLTGTKLPTRYVKTGQGFMVKSKVATASLLFNNAIRTTENGATKFFGNSAKGLEEIRDKFWINMISPTNIASNINIVYFPEGNNGFTQDDSRSLGGSDAIYSFVENEKVSINGCSSFVDTDVIPLGSQHFAAGNYKIELAGKEGIFDNGQNIYLKDMHTGIITNLSEGNYTFAANAGESSGRFEIIYKPETVLTTEGKVKENVFVYRDGNDFVVKAMHKKITTLEIYDPSGRLLQTLNSNKKEIGISGNELPNGMYVLKILQEKTTTVLKIRK